MHFLATLVHQDSTEGYKLNDFQIKLSSTSKKHETGTFNEDIMLVVMGKPGFEFCED